MPGWGRGHQGGGGGWMLPPPPQISVSTSAGTSPRFLPLVTRTRPWVLPTPTQIWTDRQTDGQAAGHSPGGITLLTTDPTRRTPEQQALVGSPPPYLVLPEAHAPLLLVALHGPAAPPDALAGTDTLHEVGREEAQSVAHLPLRHGRAVAETPPALATPVNALACARAAHGNQPPGSRLPWGVPPSQRHPPHSPHAPPPPRDTLPIAPPAPPDLPPVLVGVVHQRDPVPGPGGREAWGSVGMSPPLRCPPRVCPPPHPADPFPTHCSARSWCSWGTNL